MFRILVQIIDSRFTFSADISPFYAMIYNSKTWIGIQNAPFVMISLHI